MAHRISTANQCHDGRTRQIGDWIIYYEPRRTSADLQSRGGRQSYLATAHVQRIAPDPRREDHFYAYVTDYLEFDRAVPFKDGELYYEQGLRRSDGGTSKGAFGRAVRPITDVEYDTILKSGFVRTLIESGSKPTAVRNGLALSGTIHWMFDRGLVSVRAAIGLAGGGPTPGAGYC
jgi:hypothetical protein